MYINICITANNLDTLAATLDFEKQHQDCGAVVSFLGKVRQQDQTIPLLKMHLEHYPQVTEYAISSVIEQAKTKWPLLAVSLIHRIGELYPQDNIVFLQVAAKHRLAAFSACEYIMDFLKTEAPFWKKEILANQQTHWVDAKQFDQECLQRWRK